MSRSVFFGLALGAVALSACAPTTYGPSPSPIYNADDFAWAARSGDSAIDGRVDYREQGMAFRCAGAVGLAPETGYTRQRFQTLYGSTERAAVPAAVVRARTVEDASAQYRQSLREAQCDSQGRFLFDNLPAGSWYIIAPVTASGAEGPVVLMRRVTTRPGRSVAVMLE